MNFSFFIQDNIPFPEIKRNSGRTAEFFPFLRKKRHFDAARNSARMVFTALRSSNGWRTPRIS